MLPTGPPEGPVVISVSVTGTAEPFRLTVLGLKVRFSPPNILPITLMVTELGAFDNGVTSMVAVPVCPAVTVIAAVAGTEKSGVNTVTRSVWLDDPA